MSDLAKDLEPPVAEDEIAAAAEQPAEKETPKAEEAPKPEIKDEPDKQKFVPHQALHEERKRRQEVEANFRQLQQNQAVLEQRLQQLWQAAQPKQEVPNKEVDPLGYVDHTLNQTQAQLQQIEQWRQQQEAFAHQQRQAQQLASWAKNQASTFAADKSDFKPAYEHFIQLKSREFQAMGMPVDQIPHAVANFELGLFFQSAQTGRNPGEVIYEMAKSTGFQQKPVADEKIQTLNKGMEAAKTLGNGTPAGMPTPEQIAAMSEDEFAELKSSLAKKGKKVSDLL